MNKFVFSNFKNTYVIVYENIIIKLIQIVLSKTEKIHEENDLELRNCNSYQLECGVPNYSLIINKHIGNFFKKQEHFCNSLKEHIVIPLPHFVTSLNKEIRIFSHNIYSHVCTRKK